MNDLYDQETIETSTTVGGSEIVRFTLNRAQPLGIQSLPSIRPRVATARIRPAQYHLTQRPTTNENSLGEPRPSAFPGSRATDRLATRALFSLSLPVSVTWSRIYSAYLPLDASLASPSDHWRTSKIGRLRSPTAEDRSPPFQPMRVLPDASETGDSR